MKRRGDDLDSSLRIAEEGFEDEAALAAQEAALMRQQRTEHHIDGERVAAQRCHDDPDVGKTLLVLDAGHGRVTRAEEAGPLPDDRHERLQGAVNDLTGESGLLALRRVAVRRFPVQALLSVRFRARRLGRLLIGSGHLDERALQVFREVEPLALQVFELPLRQAWL